MTNNKQKTFTLKRRRAISPILAVVVLLGITVVAGGIVFSLFSTSATTASVTDVIAIQNAQAIKGSSHSDITATVKNAGSQPWTKVEMTVAKSELSEPILYESLHEIVQGCDDGVAGTPAATACDDDNTNVAGSRDNPLRAQWLLTLDKTGGTANQADFGEGSAAGRKLVFDSKDDNRTLNILNGTAVARLFGQSAADNSHSLNSAMTVCDISSSSDVNCITTFQELDPSVKGEALYCSAGTTTQKEAGIFGTCKMFTHQSIANDPIASGKSVYFYADAFTSSIPGLDNQIVRVGDNLVVNLFSENADGGTARVQTIIKVAGI